MGLNGEGSGTFPTGKTAQEKGLSYVPNAYVIPAPHRPSLSPEIAIVPIIDMASLRSNDSVQRSLAMEELRKACISLGFFQIINHGITETVMEEALSQANEFFNLPLTEKMKYKSDDVCKAVRYGTSLKDGIDKIKFWRVFLKHYAHPLEDWIDSWPTNPRNYREKMGQYTKEVRKVSLEIMEAITESLNLSPTYLSSKMAEGVQVVAVNCYPPCPQPGVALGLPPHTDYSCITTVLQNSQGLEIMDPADGTWKMVQKIDGALQVHVGDHVEVLSNGLYKGVVHRATVNSERTRISITSLHSLGMDEKMKPAEELVNEQNPKKYKESSFNDFLKFLSSNDLAEGNSFINTLKIQD
ncbi:protein DOWNY MILDEW RESISTANCE 6 [Cucumis melo var. makuwa]|uniref:Protein DOWNY MILDEW RESISTANCE 6 n=2 Tax=Cucumis melo TaxID=3656 RepID=A0A1S3BX86_CUCME|nr:flavanone 3-dioxygenase 3 [Cucumis melo]KAA0044683.1 protein DOWNY MILDEW RESISTANCE 6 [Cucumis melo var. makuwa]TYK16900.1 protein DOWNY MILDEW RESISTANCE 6 [Cucumis melo var. makuwa]